MVVRFHRTPRTHHRFSAPVKLLIVLLALRNAQSKRTASNKLRPSRYTAPSCSDSQASRYFHRAQTELRPTELIAAWRPPLLPRYTRPHSSYSSNARLEKTLFEMQQRDLSIDQSRGRIHLPFVTRIVRSPIRRRRPTEFRVGIVVVVVTGRRTCSRGEQSRTVLSLSLPTSRAITS